MNMSSLKRTRCHLIEDSSSSESEDDTGSLVKTSTNKKDVIKRLVTANDTRPKITHQEQDHDQEEEQRSSIFPLMSTPFSSKPTFNSTLTPTSSASSDEHFNVSSIRYSQNDDRNEGGRTLNASITSSSSSEDFRELKLMVQTLVDQNKNIMQRLGQLEQQSLSKKSKEQIIVPNHIRYQIKLAYQEREKRNGSLWKINQGLSAFEGDNMEFSSHIREFVKGLNPNLENRDVIVNSGIKTYFESKVTQARRKSKSPNVMKELARKQRRAHLSERRRKALIKHVTNDKINEESKKKFSTALIPEMMSSEDEKEDENGIRYFLVRKPAFRSKKFSKLLKIIDSAYEANCSKRSREQMVRRVVGVEKSKRDAPKGLDANLEDLFITECATQN